MLSILNNQAIIEEAFLRRVGENLGVVGRTLKGLAPVAQIAAPAILGSLGGLIMAGGNYNTINSLVQGDENGKYDPGFLGWRDLVSGGRATNDSGETIMTEPDKYGHRVAIQPGEEMQRYNPQTGTLQYQAKNTSAFGGPGFMTGVALLGTSALMRAPMQTQMIARQTKNLAQQANRQYQQNRQLMLQNRQQMKQLQQMQQAQQQQQPLSNKIL